MPTRTRPRPAVSGLAVAAAALLGLTGCGDPDSGTAGAGPGGSAGPGGGATTSADDLVASCGQVEFDSIPADPLAFPPLGEVRDHVDLDAIRPEHEMFEVHDWYVAAETGDTRVLFGVRHEPPPPTAPPYAYATVEREGERWVPDAWGQCRVTVEAPGWGNARFVLEPAAAPDPSATSVRVQAWEVGCASGEPPRDREVRPVVLDADDRSVSVVILVEPVTGGATCPSNPPFPVEITLDRPLADRSVYDAGVDPALVRPWPPTESSLSSEGREE